MSKCYFTRFVLIILILSDVSTTESYANLIATYNDNVNDLKTFKIVRDSQSRMTQALDGINDLKDAILHIDNLLDGNGQEVETIKSGEWNKDLVHKASWNIVVSSSYSDFFMHY